MIAAAADGRVILDGADWSRVISVHEAAACRLRDRICSAGRDVHLTAAAAVYKRRRWLISRSLLSLARCDSAEATTLSMASS